MVEMEVCTSLTESDFKHVDEDSTDVTDDQKLNKFLSEGRLDFDDWTSVISETESSFRDDLKKICLVYDRFLSEFPLCHGYWRKYAYHTLRLSTVEKVVEVFERAVRAATYCVAVWVDYCAFGVSAFEDPKEIRRLFERSISFVGKDYLCHPLWDKYVEFELGQQQWSSLAHIYLQSLRYPFKKLDCYYESFRMLVASLEEVIECKTDANGDISLNPVEDNLVPDRYTDNEISQVIRDLLDPSVGFTASKALQKYLLIGEQFYQDSRQLVKKIHCFETRIRRPYFHVLPLDTSQLENWHRYLDFIELHGDFDWAVKLYERCLIPCANYPEFWMRYVDFVESKGGREIANFALARATQTFLTDASVIHLFSARYKEKIGDISAACDAFSRLDMEPGSNFVENVIAKANMERRLGKFDAAVKTYKEALEFAAAGKVNLQNESMLYVHFSRFMYMMTNNPDAAREILTDGIKKMPHCKLLLEELINFSISHGGSQQIDFVDSIISKEISPETDSSNETYAKDMEDISNLYIQFVDLCGTIHDVRKAWNRHIKLFPNSIRLLISHQHRASSTKLVKDFLQKRPEACKHNEPYSNGDAAKHVSEPAVQQPSENCHVGFAHDLTDSVHQNQTGSNTADPNFKESCHILREFEEDLEQLSLDKPRKDEAPQELGTSKPKDGPVTKRAHFLLNPSGTREVDALEIQPSGTHSPAEVGTDKEMTRHGSRIWRLSRNHDQNQPGSQRENYHSAETGQVVSDQPPRPVPSGSMPHQPHQEDLSVTLHSQQIGVQPGAYPQMNQNPKKEILPVQWQQHLP